MIKNFINRKFIVKSSTMAASNFIQFSSISAIIIIIAKLSGHTYSALYGVLISLYSMLLMLPIGLMVWQISSFTPEIMKLRKFPKDERSYGKVFYLNSVFHAHSKFILKLLLGAWALFFLFFLLFTSINSTIFWISLLPLVLMSPFVSSLQAKLQVAQKEKEIFIGNLVTAVINLLSVYSLLSVPSLKSSLVTLAAVGCVQSISGIILMKYLSSQVGKLPIEYSRKDKTSDVRVSVSSIRKIISGSLDGIILSATFSLAVVSAMQNSSRDGFLIALVVSMMRIIVIPSKQFGLVGGRMYLMGQIENVKTIVLSSFISILAVSLVVFPIYLVNSSVAIPFIILALMLVQVVIEPFAGVLYGFLKIKMGPDKAVSGLILSYVFFAVPMIVVCMNYKIANAENIWMIVFFARIIFSISVVRNLFSKNK